MKNNKIILLAITLISLLGCNPRETSTTQESNASVCGAGCDTIVFNPTLPSDVKILNQKCVDVLAWQSFISLTWPADTTQRGEPDQSKTIQDWGTPGDTTPMTFGTYKRAEDIFTTQAPSPWNQTPLLRLMADLHKFDDEEVEELFQASAGAPWLTDQDSNLVWYEKKVNKVEFDYIDSNQLYIPEQQMDIWTNVDSKGLWLPNGSIEIKASWRIIPENKFDQLKTRFKIINAYVPDTAYIQNGKVVIGSGTQKVMLGLLGLHIIHKTPTAPQFIWATFEHVDLAPLESEKCVPSTTDWVLFDKNNCTAEANVQPNPQDPDCNLYDPIQVVKENVAEPMSNAKLLNEFIHGQIASLNPNSVFQYYRLVGTQWPTGAVADHDNNKFEPLLEGGKNPLVLTNASMETYVQGMSCLSCHVTAGIVDTTAEGKEYGADYSFLFQMAEEQKSTK